MSAEDHSVTFNLELNVEQVIENIRKYETLLYRSLALAKRLGLPEDISQQIEKIRQLIMAIRLAHTSMIALEAASGPVGWALATVGAVSAALTFGDMAYDATRTG